MNVDNATEGNNLARGIRSLELPRACSSGQAMVKKHEYEDHARASPVFLG